MQKTADGLKEGVQKTVFLNVSGIGCARTSLSCFFKKVEKVLLRVGNIRTQTLRKSRFYMFKSTFFGGKLKKHFFVF